MTIAGVQGVGIGATLSRNSHRMNATNTTLKAVVLLILWYQNYELLRQLLYEIYILK